MSDEGLKEDDGQNTIICGERKKQEAGSIKYLASRNDNVGQGTPGMVQSFKHGRDSHVEALPLHALGVGIEGEERRHQVLRICP